MKKQPALYWIAKVFISFFMLFSAWYSWSHAADLQALGFPDYFRIELVVAKCVGAIVLLLPQTDRWLKEWAYAGFCICMLSAFVAHACSHDPIGKLIFLGIDFVLIIVSIRYVRKREYATIT